MSDPTGKTISHYRIIDEVGRGGMGVVYAAEDLRLHRRVAVKILPPALTASLDDRARFFEEARLASSLNHPNIVTIYEFDDADGMAFMVSEFVAGRTLASMIGHEAIPLPEILDIAVQVARGLEEAHAHGIIHRDIKPENVMVSDRGQAKIMDFGLARLLGSSHVTDSGSLVGTFAYMSPEQIDEEDIDERSDIFSFGVLLYHLIAGVLPFQGKTVGEVLTSIARKRPESPGKSREGVPEDLERIVMRALQKERNRRYASMAEIRAELENLRKNPAMRRRRWPVRSSRQVLLVVGLLMSLIIAVYFLWSRADRPPHPGQTESIAVMPFVADDADDSLSFLSLGLADDIITRLSFLRNLNVKPTGAIAVYAGRQIPPSRAARELGVHYLLEGRYRKSGTQFYVSTQMIDARSENVVWAEQDVWQWREIGSVQSTLADRVLEALQLEISKAEYARVHKVRTGSPEAYEYYLRGIGFTINDSRANNEMAMRLLERAIAEDNQFAEASAELSAVYTERFWSGYSSDTAWLRRAEVTARRALALDDRLAAAHSALGFVLRVEGKYGESIREASNALALDPHTSFSLEDLSEFYRNRGDFDKAEAIARKAAEIDPSFNLARVRARILQFQGKYRESVDEIQNAIRRSPSDSWLRGGLLAYSYVHLGELEKAEREIRTAEAIDFEKPETRITRAMLWTERGDYSRAIQELRSAGSVIRDDYAAAFYAAAIYAKQGKADLALASMGNAIAHGNRWYSWYADPWFDGLRGNPRFKTYLESMKTELDGIDADLRIRRVAF